MTNRDSFVYDTSYGKTTDMYLLPEGTRFYVVSGGWYGTIEVRDGEKFIRIDGKETLLHVGKNYDMNMVVRVDSELKTLKCTACNGPVNKDGRTIAEQ